MPIWVARLEGDQNLEAEVISSQEFVKRDNTYWLEFVVEVSTDEPLIFARCEPYTYSRVLDMI